LQTPEVGVQECNFPTRHLEDAGAGRDEISSGLADFRSGSFASILACSPNVR
jgi:hypothetical protein